MARKKKNPLGQFEDALNQLGFGGQEGGSSVTDIDTVDSHVGEPNDDIDNLDNPDGDQPTEDNKDNKNTEDPNAHDDDT